MHNMEHQARIALHPIATSRWVLVESPISNGLIEVEAYEN